MLPECVLIVGPSGCGKTHALLRDILKAEKSRFYDYIFIICPTFNPNETYQEWVGLKDKCVFGAAIPPEKLDAVINFILTCFDGSKVVIDGMSSSGEQHLNFSMVTYCISHIAEDITKYLYLFSARYFAPFQLA